MYPIEILSAFSFTSFKMDSFQNVYQLKCV